jgi:hypothetical protein
MSSLDFFHIFSIIPSPPPHHHADGDQCMVQRAASNGAFNIMHPSVMGSPVMDEMNRQGQKEYYDCSAFLGHSTYDSDSDSEDSVKRLTRVLACSNNFHRLRNVL